jgi:DNA-binding beta-propeller fold protein YncE
MMVKRLVTYAIYLAFATILVFLSSMPRVYATAEVRTVYQASDLLGQLDSANQPVFTTKTVNNGAGLDYPNKQGFGIPQKVVIDTEHHRLFVSDLGNNRILVFNLDTSNTLADHVSDYVLGQVSFGTNNVGTTATKLSAPRGIIYDSVHDRLFVADSANHRVLIFDTRLIVNGEAAVNVIGQVRFNANAQLETPTQSSLSFPYDVAYDSDRDWLYVLSFTDRRVLVFDVDPTTMRDGENALYVIGAADFTTTAAVLARNRLLGPHGMLYETKHKRLFVADYYAHRVMVFDMATVTNGEDAVHVLGQPDFTSRVPKITQNGMFGPFYLAYDAENERMFISDSFSNRPPNAWSNRVLVFDVDPATMRDGEDALAVIGQPDFTSYFRNAGGATSERGLNDPRGIVFDQANNRLYVPEKSNSRITIFNFIRVTDQVVEDGTLNQAYAFPITTAWGQGTVSMSVSSGTLPPGLALRGTEIVGTPTAAGSYRFTLQAADIASYGTFLSNKQTITMKINK